MLVLFLFLLKPTGLVSIWGKAEEGGTQAGNGSDNLLRS